MTKLNGPAFYPRYFKSDKYLLAFIGPADMYKIEPRGTNKNEGLAVDHYITRTMVLKYYGHGDIISRQQFRDLVTNLFHLTTQKICSL